MNIRQAMQAGPAKANELFAKLSDTSNGAVKTREKVFGELKTELELLVDLEEKHLLPLLGKHKETKDLVPEAIKGNKELRARLQELDGMPKHEDAFVLKLAALQKGFQQHVRDGRKELLPAVQKVLSEQEASGVAEGIEAGRAEAEQAKREEAEKARAEAREGREKAERQAAAAEQAKRDEAEKARAKAREDGELAKREAAERAAQESTREAAKALARSASVARDTSHRVVEGTAEGARRVAASAQDTVDVQRGSLRAATQGVQAVATASRATTGALVERQAEGLAEGARHAAGSIQDTVEVYRASARTATLGVQAFATASQVATKGMVEMQAEGQAWMSRAIEDGMRASGELMRCTTPRQVAEVQGGFLAAAARNWLESGARLLTISQRTAGEALPALRGGLDAAAEAGRR